MDANRECKACGVTKPIDEFYKNAGGVGGRESRCKDCKKSGHKGSRKRSPPPKAAVEGTGAPEFLSVQTQETYVISGADETSIALTREDLEAVYQWWKVKRKVA